MQAGTSATADIVRRLTVGDCNVQSERDALLTKRLGAAATSVVSSTVSFTQAGSNASAASPGVVGGGVTYTVVYKTANFNFPFIPVPNNSQITRTVFGRVEDTTASTGGCT